MKTLDQLIQEAKDALNKAEAGSTEHAAATGRVEALTSMKQEGYTFTQDDLNRVNKQGKDEINNAWKEVFEMELDEAKTAKEALGESVGSDKGEGGSGDEGNVLTRMQSTIEAQQQQIKDLGEANQSTSRSLFSERVENNLRRAFSELEVGEGEEKSKVSLKGDRFEFVRGLAGEQDLVEKLMKGETLPGDIYEQRARQVYQGLPEVFATEGGSEETTTGPGERTVAGHKIKEEATPGIPATSSGGNGGEITHEDRAARATSVY